MKYLLSATAVAAVLAIANAPAYSQGTAGPSASPPLQAAPQGKAQAPRGKARATAGTAGPSASEPLTRTKGGKARTSGKKARATSGTAGPSNNPPGAGR